jgi:16S rRNA C967 or C1407 C5-methylase (RsmB/RsmF family)
VAETVAILAADGLAAAPVSWHPGALRLERPGASAEEIAPGSSLAFIGGLVHVQEEASLLPVALLDPQPGERVADLCAAPGGKTAQIALAMDNRGTLLANDRDWRRMTTMGRNLERMGVANVVVTIWDAANMPESTGPFDRVLADVPCSCEGTSRKAPGVLGRATGVDRERLAAAQSAILAKAVRLARPGGRIVYSTCTYAPEENELVVAGALEAGGVRVVPVGEIAPAGVRLSPGLTAWQGRRLPAELEGTGRLWPHVQDTGGFYVAVLQKTADGELGGRSGRGETAPIEDVDDAQSRLAALEDRYGIPRGTFERFRVVHHGRRRLALLPRETHVPAHPEPRAWGLSFTRTSMRFPKPTTAATLAFGRLATRSVVEVDHGRARAFVERRETPWTPGPPQAAAVAGREGQVVVRFRGAPFGIGELRGTPPASLGSLFPKRW